MVKNIKIIIRIMAPNTSDISLDKRFPIPFIIPIFPISEEIVTEIIKEKSLLISVNALNGELINTMKIIQNKRENTNIQDQEAFIPNIYNHTGSKYKNILFV